MEINVIGKAILVLSSFYHLIAGIMSIGPSKWLVYFGKKTYSLEIAENFEPRYQLTVRALGKFALFTSSILFYIALYSDKKTQQFVLINLGVLFLIRALLRVLQKELFYKAYKIDFNRSLKNIIFNIILGLCTIVVGILY